MTNQPAFKEITQTYDIEDMQEIVNHGCQSGVCHSHIYYADTISFFDKYEDEIYSEIETCFGVDTLVQLFTEADASLTHYKNSVVWLYIEHVCSVVITTMEEEEYAQDQMIAEYMSIEDAVVDPKTYAGPMVSTSDYNPPSSMTMNRYCQV